MYSKSYGALNNAMGGATLFEPSGFESVSNPAFLSFSKKKVLSISQELPYFQKDLAISAITFTHSIKQLPYSIAFIQTGNPYFLQHILAFACSQKLAKQLYLGVKLNYLHTQQFQNKTAHTLIGGIGVILGINGQISIHSSLTNFNGAAFPIKTEQHLPLQLAIGINYKIQDQLKWMLEFNQLEKIQKNCLGISYEPNKKIKLVAGVDLNSQQAGFGMSYKAKSINLNIAMANHKTLGLWPICDLQYLFK
ncbi:MAG: hypothetical protein CFE21_13570 [Bacteroidetes bacterium B1(2017)]|nr:MAG: hypothetical protein CFE21_13570 [Bacteroidetes bacterium B1(2017)]